MKMMKLAVLPVAIAGVLASNAAFAGSEACFEVYKQADATAVQGWADLYANASCVAEADRTGATTANLQPTVTSKIAYELTKNKDLDFAAVDGVDQDLQIVYIPTTDIPGGTLVKMQLSGATFKGNAGQIHLMKTGNATVASSDGAVDGQNTVTFLTKAGVTIGAGTRLVLTKNNTSVVPVSINIANTACANDESTAKVTIKATSAKTDGGNGYDIQGAVSGTQDVVDISAQFITFNGLTPAQGEVNAESTNSASSAIVARTEFVFDATNQSLEQQKYQIVAPVGFINRGALLDQAVTLGADDHLVQKFWATTAPTANVKAGIYNAYTAATKALASPVAVQTGTQYGVIAATSAGATAYNTEATDVFTPSVAGGTNVETVPAAYAGAAYNQLFYVVENTDPTAIMNFNYSANVDAQLQLNNADYLDHCSKSKVTHEIGVNGAVLKVPYSFDSSNTWVRITNESNETADITMDIFDESGHEKTSIVVGTVGAKSSNVLIASDLVAKAKAAGLTTDGKGRYTMTFTVTAPKNTVHGVSVQKIPGGVDRVVPVLDQNDWKM